MNMHYLKRITRENREDAVSPVVGVMLMLVVTIIIAAVVSAFAGGLVGGSNTATPTLSMDVKIANTGSYATSSFAATVLGISAPTATQQLKLSTSWVTTMKDNSTYTSGIPKNTANGASFAGGATVTAASATTSSQAPYGFGPGITGPTISMSYPYNMNQSFGNYTLEQGTGLIAEAPTGYINYVAGGSGQSGGPSGMNTVLGSGWEQLRTGDVVTVRVIYAPTGKIVYQKDVVVTGV